MSGIFDTSSVSYLQNSNIDKDKWDKCIDTASNGLIYAYSFYLDTMAKHWDALVMNNYEAVMPITWNKKYGIYYLYQPFLCVSLGVFGNNITGKILSCFLEKIPKRFKYWDIYLNAENNFPIEKYNLYKRINYTLRVNEPYTALLNNFRNSYKQLIKKTTTYHLRVKKNINVEEIISLEKIQLGTASKVKNTDWEKFC